MPLAAQDKRPVVNFCEHGNEPPLSIEGGECLDYLSYKYLFGTLSVDTVCFAIEGIFNLYKVH